MDGWKDVVGFEGFYQVNERGEVLSLVNNHGHSVRRILKPKVAGRGYLSVCLSKNKQRYYRYIHRIVAEAFIGCVAKKEVNHKDFDKTNNNLSNLEIVLPRENYDHAKKGKRYRFGESYGRAIFKDADIKEIRLLYASGKFTQKEIADRYGAHQSHISLIVRGKIWSHVK